MRKSTATVCVIVWVMLLSGIFFSCKRRRRPVDPEKTNAQTYITQRDIATTRVLTIFGIFRHTEATNTDRLPLQIVEMNQSVNEALAAISQTPAMTTLDRCRSETQVALEDLKSQIAPVASIIGDGEDASTDQRVNASRMWSMREGRFRLGFCKYHQATQSCTTEARSMGLSVPLEDGFGPPLLNCDLWDGSLEAFGDAGL